MFSYVEANRRSAASTFCSDATLSSTLFYYNTAMHCWSPVWPTCEEACGRWAVWSSVCSEVGLLYHSVVGLLYHGVVGPWPWTQLQPTTSLALLPPYAAALPIFLSDSI